MKRGGHVAGGRFRKGFAGGPWFVPAYYVAPCDPLTDPWCYLPIGGERTELQQRVPGDMSPVGDEFRSRRAGNMSPVGYEFDSRMPGKMIQIGSDTTALLAGMTAEDPLWAQLDDAFTHLIIDTPSRFNPTDTVGDFDPALSQLYHKFVDDFVAWRAFYNGYLTGGPEWFGLTSQEDQIRQLNQWKERRIAWVKDFESVTAVALPGATRLEQRVIAPPSGLPKIPTSYLVGGGIAAAILLLLGLRR